MYSQKDIIKLSDIVKDQEEKRKEYMRKAFYLPKIFDKKKKNKNLRFSYGLMSELIEARAMLCSYLDYNNIFDLKRQAGDCNKDIDILRVEKEYKTSTGIYKRDFFKIKKDGDKIFYRTNKYIKYNNEAYDRNIYIIIGKKLYKYEDLKELYIGTIDGKEIFCKRNTDLPYKDEDYTPCLDGFMNKNIDEDHPINVLLSLMSSYPSKVSSQLLKYKDNIKKLKEIKISKEIEITDDSDYAFIFAFCKAFNLFDAKMCKSDNENTYNYMYIFKINNLLELLIFTCVYVYRNKDNKILNYLSYLVKERENEKIK